MYITKYTTKKYLNIIILISFIHFILGTYKVFHSSIHNVARKLIRINFDNMAIYNNLLPESRE